MRWSIADDTDGAAPSNRSLQRTAAPGLSAYGERFLEHALNLARLAALGVGAAPIAVES